MNSKGMMVLLERQPKDQEEVVSLVMEEISLQGHFLD